MVYTKTANGPADYLLAAAPGSLDGLEEAMRWWWRNHSGITEGFANALLNPVDLLARRSAVTTSEA